MSNTYEAKGLSHTAVRRAVRWKTLHLTNFLCG